MAKSQWSEKITGWASWNRKISTCKANARKRSLPYDLEVADFILISSQQCSYCGKPPKKWRYREGKKTPYIYANGLDRLDNRLGYSLSNVVSCCEVCNRMKSDLASDEFYTHIENIYKNILT